MLKTCNKCHHQWESRDSFLSDNTIELLGYQVFFKDLRLGMFMFNHSCNTTIAIETDLFLDLYNGPIYFERKPVGDHCPGRCLNKNIMLPCSPECKCAFVGDLIKIIKQYNIK